MPRNFVRALAAFAILTPIAFGQSTGTTTTPSSGTPQIGRLPSDNMRSFRDRAPGTWVQRAIARHKGTGSSTSNTGSTTNNSSSTSTSNSSSSGLSGLLNSVLSSGLLGNLGSTLGGLTGASSTSGSTTGTNTTSTTGTNTTNSSTTGTNGIPSNVPQSVIDQIVAAGIDPNTIFAKSTDAASDGTQTNPKTTPREQSSTTTTTTQPFKVRLANTLLQTFFTALTVGFQSQNFITSLKDMFRPLLPPAASQSTTTTGTNNSTSTDTTGGGIENSGGGNNGGTDTTSPI
ncbi:MAG: hypothetical protein U1D55_06235 [Phycisphaerae bacterium]